VRHVAFESFPTRRSSDLVATQQGITAMGYVIVKLYKTREWAPSTVAVEDYPEHAPWDCDNRGAFRYVRIPRSMWNDIEDLRRRRDRKSTRLNSSHVKISY